MPRAQCIVYRDNKLLLAKHRMNGEEWWCLPGGGIEDGETPVEATLRELKEECCVEGKIIAEVSHITYPLDSESYTYLVDIGNQEPKMGVDPDSTGPFLVDIAWMSLKAISEKSRVFLWWSGLLGIPGFFAEVEGWGEDTSYPNTSEK